MDIPARYSVDQPDYDPRFGSRLQVALDGVEQSKVVAYDIEAGTVTRPRCDEDGKLIIEGEEVALEVVFGRVDVELRPSNA